MIEIEAKWLNINVAQLTTTILNNGGTKVDDFFYRRIVFDYPDFRLNKQGAWIRLRDEGNKITLGFKQRLGMTSHDGSTSDTGMKEIEVVVSDFEKTKDLLLSIGLIVKFEQHNERTRYILGGVELDIDTWPRLPPYLEIEAKTWIEVDKTAQLLGLDTTQKIISSTHQVYKMNGIDELDYIKMTFEEFVKR